MLYTGRIVEYDIEHANISVLYDKGLITTENYLLLKETKKSLRNEVIGKLILDNKNVWEEISSGVKEAMRKFVRMNKITKAKVIEVVTDAIWLRDCDVKHTRITDCIMFVPKNECSLMLKLDKISIYKKPDSIMVRGGRINKEHESYHYMLQFLTALENRETKLLQRTYTRLRKSLIGAESKLISSVENNELIKQIKAYAA